MKTKIIFFIFFIGAYITAASQNLSFWYGDFYCSRLPINKYRLLIEGIKDDCSRDIVFPEEVADEEGNVYQVWNIGFIIPEDVKSIKIPYTVPEISFFPLFKNNYESTEIPINFYGDKEKAHYCISDGFLYRGINKDSLWAPLYAKKNYVIPEGVRYIRGFHFLDSLENISLPQTLEELGSLAFMDCANISEIIVPKSVRYIGPYAFEGCVGVKKIDLPNVEEIGHGAFEGCKYLEEAVLSGPIQSIGNRAFINCNSLKTIILPDTMRRIGEECFKGTQPTTKITFPLSVDTIGDGAFCDWKVKRLVLSENTKLIGVRSLYCVDTVICKNPTPPEIYDNTYTPPREYWTWFDNCKVLYVPKGTVESYMLADGWRKVKDIREIGSPDPAKPKENSCPDDNHPHAIDLGLPSGTLWACCNVGAGKPEEYGGYYAWGETEEKDVYNEVTYQYCTGVDSDGNGWFGYPDPMPTYQDLGSDIAGTQYDVAHVKWGGSWVMPSYEQIKELLLRSNISYTWTSRNGIQGGQIASKINGETIFLPAAAVSGDDCYRVGKEGCYSSSMDWRGDPYSYRSIYSFHFDSENIDYHTLVFRAMGYTVRPVITPNANINHPKSIIDISSQDASQAVYNLQGIKVADSIEGLRTLLPGLYILNGKKFLVK